MKEEKAMKSLMCTHHAVPRQAPPPEANREFDNDRSQPWESNVNLCSSSKPQLGF
jgi:hypothetical protein